MINSLQIIHFEYAASCRDPDLKNFEGLLTGNDGIECALQGGLSGCWVEVSLGAARIRAELLTVLSNPGILVTNIDSRAPPLKI